MIQSYRRQTSMQR